MTQTWASSGNRPRSKLPTPVAACAEAWAGTSPWKGMQHPASTNKPQTVKETLQESDHFHPSPASKGGHPNSATQVLGRPGKFHSGEPLSPPEGQNSMTLCMTTFFTWTKHERPSLLSFVTIVKAKSSHSFFMFVHS